MTTTELIDILKKHEFGGITKKPREICIEINNSFIPEPTFKVLSTGDGIAGAEISIEIIDNREKMTKFEKTKQMTFEELTEFIVSMSGVLSRLMITRDEQIKLVEEILKMEVPK